MYRSNRSFNIPPPGIPRAFDVFSCPVWREFDHYSLGVGNLIASLDFMLRVALISRGVIKTSLHAFKAKDTRFVADWLKSKGLHKLVLYLKVFKNHLYYLWHVRVLSIKPCLCTQLPEHSKSYRKVSRGGGI